MLLLCIFSFVTRAFLYCSRCSATRTQTHLPIQKLHGCLVRISANTTGEYGRLSSRVGLLTDSWCLLWITVENLKRHLWRKLFGFCIVCTYIVLMNGRQCYFCTCRTWCVSSGRFCVNKKLSCPPLSAYEIHTFSFWLPVQIVYPIIHWLSFSAFPSGKTGNEQNGNGAYTYRYLGSGTANVLPVYMEKLSYALGAMLRRALYHTFEWCP